MDLYYHGELLTDEDVYAAAPSPNKSKAFLVVNADTASDITVYPVRPDGTTSGIVLGIPSGSSAIYPIRIAGACAQNTNEISIYLLY